MGLDELHLRVLAASSDDPKEKKNAQKGAPRAIQYLPYGHKKLTLMFYSSP